MATSVTTALALEASFRHLVRPLRWWQGPGQVVIGDDEFVRGGQVVVDPTSMPTWSKLDPTGFAFRYVVAPGSRQEFFRHTVEGVPVRLFRCFLVGQAWVELDRWRFEGRITGAVWDTSVSQVVCPVVPWSRTAARQPRVGVWSHRSQLEQTGGSDTGFRWLRGRRKASTLFPGRAG